MIWIDRTQEPRPRVLDPDGRPVQEERAAAVEHIEKQREMKDPHALLSGFKNFKLYKHREVKAALTRLFHGKCAYCESHYATTQPMEVEHWRPKALVVLEVEGGRERRLGYWWRAADWENLLPSCIRCNREGKANLWPLADEESRANPRGCPDLDPVCDEHETPLLLNPCRDDPAHHLEFVADGVVLPRPQEHGGTGEAPRCSRKGEASIRVYGLNRVALIQSRREIYLEIQHRIELVLQLTVILDSLRDRDLADDDDLPDLVGDLIEHEIRTLTEYGHPDRPYAQMARQLTERFFARYGPGSDSGCRRQASSSEGRSR